MNHMKFVNWVTIWVVHLIYRYGPKPAGLTTVSEQTVGSAVLQIKLTQFAHDVETTAHNIHETWHCFNHVRANENKLKC